MDITFKRTSLVVIALAALVLSLWAFAQGVFRSNRPVAGSSDDTISQAMLDRFAERGPGGIVRAQLFEIGNRKELDESDAKLLLNAAQDPIVLFYNVVPRDIDLQIRDNSTEKIVLTRIALVNMSHLLQRATMDAHSRSQFEDAIIAAPSDDRWRIRSTALTLIQDANLLNRDGVREKVRRLTNDEEPEVVEKAHRLWQYLDQER